jgi:hypothetical protein
MPEPRQVALRDPEFLRVMAENLEFQRIAALRQWETLLRSPMLPIVELHPTPRIQEIIQIHNPPDRTAT